jgi:hypothetical protein
MAEFGQITSKASVAIQMTDGHHGDTAYWDHHSQQQIAERSRERYDRFKIWKSQKENKRGEREIKFEVRHIVL